MTDDVRATILVTGRVQGVFYRATAMEQAQRLAITGFAKNLPDGAVEAVVEGPEAAVERFIAWCKLGPPAAKVEQVHVRFTPARAEFRTFTIDR
jgi:acylphosphatase